MTTSSNLKRALTEEDQLYFIHVPKCAGTSFISLVDEHFVIDEICPTHYDLKKLQNELTDQQLQNYKFIRGHLPYDLVVPRLKKKPRTITFLRDPVTQFISYFQMRQRVPDPLVGLQEHLQGLSIEEVLTLDQSTDSETRRPLDIFTNNATRLLTSFNKGARLKPEVYDLSIQRLKTCDFIGITEEFDKSIELFCYIFDFPLPLNQRQLNISPNREKRQIITPETLRQIKSVQHLDMQLYEYGKHLFEEMYAQMQDEKTNRMESITRNKQVVNSIFFDFSRVDLGMGWHVAERVPKHGAIRWSGPETSSYLFFPLTSNHDLILQFCVIHAISPDILRSLRLKVNEKDVALTKRTNKDGSLVFEARIPRRVLELSSRMTSLKFEVNRTSQPKEVNPSNSDERRLGLCYDWLSIYPE